MSPFLPQAAHHGHAGHWTSDDVEAARQEANGPGFAALRGRPRRTPGTSADRFTRTSAASSVLSSTSKPRILDSGKESSPWPTWTIQPGPPSLVRLSAARSSPAAFSLSPEAHSSKCYSHISDNISVRATGDSAPGLEGGNGGNAVPFIKDLSKMAGKVHPQPR